MGENKQLTTVEQNALCVKYEVLGTTIMLDKDFVKKYLVRGTPELITDQELVFFMNTCKMQKLNPLAGGEAYCIKFSKDEPAQLVVGKGAYMRRAYEHPEYLCKEDGIIVQRGNEIVVKEGCCVYPSEILVGGWCRVHYIRNGTERTCYKEVELAEYDKGKANWKSKPATMINKVAVSQCVREAFPKDYEGLYSEDELVASGAIPAEQTDNGQSYYGKEEIVANVDRVITQDERKKMFAYAQQLFGETYGNNTVAEIIADMGLQSTANLKLSQYNDIMAELDARYQILTEGDADNQ